MTLCTATMSWDFNNKLRSADTNNDATDDVFYLWDSLGRRVGRTASGTTTIYVQNDQQTLADYSSGALASSPTYNYAWGTYVDELVFRTSNTGNLYFHHNQQFSIIAGTASTGSLTERYAYSPYGELEILNALAVPIASSTIDNRYTFTGREWDSVLKLYHFRARMMSPVAGRFVSRDPIEYKGSEWNLYEYTGGSPLHRKDPSGRMFGWGYGRYCGWSRRASCPPGSGAPPNDATDAACERHDCCQCSIWTFWKFGKCTIDFCYELHDAYEFGCKQSYPSTVDGHNKRRACEKAAFDAALLFCAGAYAPEPKYWPGYDPNRTGETDLPPLPDNVS